MTKFIYICSPYGGLRENAKRAHEYGQAVAKEGYIPIIPHVMWHGIFKDADPDERIRALSAGLELLKHCDELRYFGKEITPGMAQEINFARANGIPVVKGQAGTVNGLGEIFRFFEENFLFINRTVVDIFTDYVEQGMTPELIKEAIKQTAKKNAGVTYMEAILNNWVAKKIFTVQKLRETAKKHTEAVSQSEYGEYLDKIINSED